MGQSHIKDSAYKEESSTKMVNVFPKIQNKQKRKIKTDIEGKRKQQ